MPPTIAGTAGPADGRGSKTKKESRSGRGSITRVKGAAPTLGAGTRFLADTMLGKLAKWLRILGYDVLYARDLDDHALLALARAEGRTLLTRDEELARRSRGILISSDDWREQLRELSKLIRLEKERLFSRCLECNTPLEQVKREEVADRVSPYLLASQAEFGRCPRCQRIYWKGTHFASALAEISGIEGINKER